MAEKERRAKEIMAAIRTILLNDWDPIGIARNPEWPRDEYDAYIGEIYRFLVRGESAEFVARHLCFIEDKLMGLGCADVVKRLPVAQKLKSLDVSV